MDARDYSAKETLKDGRRVTIRAIRPDDRDALAAAFRGLEERTIHLRFFAPKAKLTPKELHDATNVDFVRTVALVTCPEGDGRERIIGGGRYATFGDEDRPARAEVAFTVEEDYQGLGIASLTLRHLARIAREQGIAEFHAEVLPENQGMLAVVRRSGFPVEERRAEGVVHVTLALAAEAR